MNTRTTVTAALAVLLIMATTTPLLAFNYPLSSEAIRDAYFLSSGDSDKRAAFFEKYRHSLPVRSRSGPQVSMIEIETPFSYLVNELAAGSPNEHAEEAEQKYLGKPGHFQVRVDINLSVMNAGLGFGASELFDAGQNFKVHLKQGTEIEPLSIHNEPIYDYSGGGPSGIVGVIIEAEYDVAKIDGGGLVTIDVDTPDGQEVETTFALNNLR